MDTFGGDQRCMVAIGGVWQQLVVLWDLPFDLSTAPLVLTHVMSRVAAYAHRKGIRLHIYLDDWLLPVAGCTAAPSGQDVHAGPLCLPGPDHEFPEIKPDSSPGFRFWGIYFQTVSFICHPLTDRWKELFTLLHDARNAFLYG